MGTGSFEGLTKAGICVLVLLRSVGWGPVIDRDRLLRAMATEQVAIVGRRQGRSVVEEGIPQAIRMAGSFTSTRRTKPFIIGKIQSEAGHGQVI